MSKLLCLYGIRNTGFYVPGGIGNKYIKEKVSNSKTVYRIASTLEELVPSRNSYWERWNSTGGRFFRIKSQLWKPG